MTKSKWANIVYSATFEIDYRILAIPQDFNSENNENRKWLEKYITATTSVAEGLRETPRWSLFRNEGFCVVGVTSMLKDLVKCSNSENLLLIETQDFKNREIYGFWGYITQIKPNEVIQIPKMNLQLFHDLHTYVKDQWLAKEYSKRTEITEYNKVFSDDELVMVNQVCNLKNGELNYEDSKVNLWSVSENEALWLAMANSQKPTSLCLNLAREIDVIKSKFLNTTTLCTKEFCERERTEKNVRNISAKDNPPPLSKDSITNNYDRTPEERKDCDNVPGDDSSNSDENKLQRFRKDLAKSAKEEMQETVNSISQEARKIISQLIDKLPISSDDSKLNGEEQMIGNKDNNSSISNEQLKNIRREVPGFKPKENQQKGDDEIDNLPKDNQDDWF
jgi:hypothetical protein